MFISQILERTIDVENQIRAMGTETDRLFRQSYTQNEIM